MKKRTQIEAELAQLALEIGGKSHSEAAKAVLDLYKGLALLEAEETIEQQLAEAQQDMQSQLRAKIAELQSEVSVPEIDVPTPTPEAPVAAAPATTVAPEEEDNQLSLVDVAEEIEKEEAEKAAQILPEEVKEIEAEEPVLKSREDRTVFQLDEAVEPAPAAPIGFVKDLFDGSAEDFNRVVSQLNTLGSLGEAQDFLTTHIAPEYGWADNEETAERFMAAVEQRFG